MRSSQCQSGAAYIRISCGMEFVCGLVIVNRRVVRGFPSRPRCRKTERRMSLKAAEQTSDSPTIDDQADGTGHRYRLEGCWRSANVHGVLRRIDDLSKRSSGGAVVIDLAGLSDVDTAGALLIDRLKKSQEQHGA